MPQAGITGYICLTGFAKNEVFLVKFRQGRALFLSSQFSANRRFNECSDWQIFRAVKPALALVIFSISAPEMRK